MNGRLRVVRAGPGATIQDAGRHGYLRYGVVASGPMDWIAYEIANRALGNPQNSAAIEIAVGGIELACEEQPVRVAFAGGVFGWMHFAASALPSSSSGRSLPSAAVVQLAPGERLLAKSGRWGTWSYLAIEGGFDVPLALGSRSTYARFAIGGLEGRALREGDVLSPLCHPERSEHRERSRGTATQPAISTISSSLLERRTDRIRVALGPQDDYFTPDALATFFREAYTVSTRFDRMGYWLDGPRVEHAGGYDIVSDGIPLGAIQVPGDGRPLVLMADHQATGGYPKLGTVIRADIGALAQYGPGEPLYFECVDVDTARDALLAIYAKLNESLSLIPLQREPTAERLLASNLVGGVIDGSE